MTGKKGARRQADTSAHFPSSASQVADIRQRVALRLHHPAKERQVTDPGQGWVRGSASSLLEMLLGIVTQGGDSDSGSESQPRNVAGPTQGKPLPASLHSQAEAGAGAAFWQRQPAA